MRAYDRRRIAGQGAPVVGRERRGRAYDVLAETDYPCPFGGRQVRRDHVLEGYAAIKIFVGFQIGVAMAGACLLAVVFLRKEARGAQDQDVERLVAVKQLA